MPTSTVPPTFSAVLADQLRRDPSRPLVTFYDDVTGERVELSVVTYANWVAKTAGLLQDELELERGGTVLVELPTHWLGPVWLGAAWTLGLSVTDDPAAAPAADLVVCGPAGVDRHAAGNVPVVALSLLPMGTRFATPLPDGVLDFGVAVWGQPDSFHPVLPPAADDPAWSGTGGGATQAELLVADAAAATDAAGTRLLTDVNPCSRTGLDAFLGPLASGGGTVWVAHPDPAQWDRHAQSEQVTAQLRVAG